MQSERLGGSCFQTAGPAGARALRGHGLRVVKDLRWAVSQSPDKTGSEHTGAGVRGHFLQGLEGHGESQVQILF